MIVNVKMESKRYNCEFSLREKITVVTGDSAVGKTEFTRRLSGREITEGLPFQMDSGFLY